MFAEDDAVNDHFLCRHQRQPLLHEEVHTSVCAVTRLVGVVWFKKSSSSCGRSERAARGFIVSSDKREPSL